ncbi:hypothetical protein [Methylobacterium sp. J-068]|uniref:hypothetical protein n=1 Tax=Methylobacterium sp. J-068 TaxID=2836649 RepID=UPI001FBAC993|nr:hypothetical protein [Methylobacterium sp. J-068]MCJ2034557.1 hypothetical protein [Methylobacterium sp. J-068]
MSFTVSARVSARQFSFRHHSMLSALDQSLSLVISGMSDVRIVEADGRVHTPAALQALLFGARPSVPGVIAPTPAIAA